MDVCRRPPAARDAKPADASRIGSIYFWTYLNFAGSIRTLKPGLRLCSSSELAMERIAVLQSLKITTSTGLGAMTFLTWDICITIEDEVRQMWSRPWNLLKFLYIFLRYFSLGVLWMAQILVLALEGGLVLSLRGCYIWIGFQGMSSVILQMGVQTLLILRLHALYESAFLRRFLAFLFCAEAAITTIVFALNLPRIRFGEQCAIIGMPVVAIAFFAPPILFETLLFALTMIKFYQALRDGWGREPVMSRFLQDGIWVFALPFVSSTVNLFCLVVWNGPMASIAFPWVIAIAGFTGYRLVLNMSHLLGDHLTESRLVADTVPEVLEEEEMRHRHYRSRFSPRQDMDETILTIISEGTTDTDTL